MPLGFSKPIDQSFSSSVSTDHKTTGNIDHLIEWSSNTCSESTFSNLKLPSILPPSSVCDAARNRMSSCENHSQISFDELFASSAENEGAVWNRFEQSDVGLLGADSHAEDTSEECSIIGKSENDPYHRLSSRDENNTARRCLSSSNSFVHSDRQLFIYVGDGKRAQVNTVFISPLFALEWKTFVESNLTALCHLEFFLKIDGASDHAATYQYFQSFKTSLCCEVKRWFVRFAYFPDQQPAVIRTVPFPCENVHSSTAAQKTVWSTVPVTLFEASALTNVSELHVDLTLE